MFTGIIKELGSVKDIKRIKGVQQLSILAKSIHKDANIGDSIAVNGACLTLVNHKKNELVFEVMDESLKRTNLGKLRRNDKVNLESSLRLDDKLSGHLVSGHIDGTGLVRKINKTDRTCQLQIEFPSQFKRYIVPKGSIAIDGVSLTIGEVGTNWFSVYIIPHTLVSTRLNFMRVKDPVNIELDMMAKYAQSKPTKDEVITETFLKKNNFL